MAARNERKRGGKLWARGLVAAAVILIGTGAIGVYFLTDSQPEQTARDEASEVTIDSIRTLYESGKFKDALPQLKVYVRENPNDIEARTMLASSYWLSGETEEALAEYGRILKIEPGDADTHYRLGILLNQRGQIDEAVAHLERAGKLRPGSPLFQVELAKAYGKQGKFDRAIASWKKAVSDYANDSAKANVYAQMGDTYVQMGKPAEAREAYQQGLELEPDNDYIESQLKKAEASATEVD